MSKYADKTDPELVILVAERRGLQFALLPIGHDKCEIVVINEEANKFIQFDPCNNPSDAWPIILEAEIDVNYLKSEPGIVLASKGDYYARSRNRLRAQMEVYLMMEDEA